MSTLHTPNGKTPSREIGSLYYCLLLGAVSASILRERAANSLGWYIQHLLNIEEKLG